MESTLGIKAQVIRAVVSVPRDPWILEERARKEPMQEKDSGVKDLPGIKALPWTCRRRSRAGERRFRSSKSPWRYEVPRDLPEAGEYAPL